MVVEVKPQRTEEYSDSGVRTLLSRYAHAKAIKDMTDSEYNDMKILCCDGVN